MKKFGSWSEQADTKFRSNSQEITLAPAGSPAASYTLTLPDVSAGDTLIGRASADQDANRIKNKHFDGPTALFVDDADTSKRAWIDPSLLSTSTTVPLVLPNEGNMVAGTLPLVGTNTNQILTNKTISAASNTISNISDTEIKSAAAINATKIADGSVSNAEFQRLAAIGSAVVGVSDTQTLSNKTLTLPQINDTSADHQYIIGVNELAADRTVTLPLLGASDTFVFESHTQGLSNKTITTSTIDADNNTVSNIANDEIKAGAAIAVNKLATVTASRALASDGSGFISASSVTSTELGYVSGVTSGIQSQIDSKQADVVTTRGDLVYGDASGDAARLGVGASGQILSTDGTDVFWDSPAGTGDVTAASNMTDNSIVRGDGGAKGVQDSGVYIDDSGNLGAGIVSPDTSLHISGTNNTTDGNLKVESTGNNGVMTLFGSGATGTARNWMLATNFSEFGNLDFRVSSTSTGDPDTAAMSIDSAGQVGIGETAPQASLHIKTADTGITPNSSASQLAIEGTGNSGLGIYTNNTSSAFILFGDTESTAAGNIRYNHSTNTMSFKTNDTDRVYIDSAGDMGVGTSSPAKRLEVTETTDEMVARFTSSDNIGAGLSINATGTSGEEWRIFSAATSASATAGSLNFYSGTQAAYRMTIEASGRVGIGTTGPASTLHIAGNEPRIQLTDNNTGADSFIDANSGQGSLFIKADDNNEVASSNIQFFIDGAEHARITSAGRVGIGTSSPDYRLDVESTTANDVGTALRNFSTTGFGTFISTGSTANNRYALRVQGGNTSGISGNDIIYARADGNVGLGVSSPRFNLETEGSHGYGVNVLADSLDVSDVSFASYFSAGTNLTINRLNGASATNGQIVYVLNSPNSGASVTVTFVHDSGSGTGEAIICPNSTNVVLGAGEGATLAKMNDKWVFVGLANSPT